MKININADVGESFGRYTLGNDPELLPLIGSASIACGMHAGDPCTMADTIRLARDAGISVGAHPGFDDRWGFGRRRVDMGVRELEHLIMYQIGALQAIAASQGMRVTHVKPHGALNNMAIEIPGYARAIGHAIKGADSEIIFVSNYGSNLQRAGEELGLTVAREFYADRRYDDAANIISRKNENAMIHDPSEAVDQIMRALQDGVVISVAGNRIPVEVDSICIHGDEPTAVPVARAIREAIVGAGWEIVALPDLGLSR